MMPCFFHRSCGGVAEVEKQGKALCRNCAGSLKGLEYPLRKPGLGPLFSLKEEQALIGQMGMREAAARNRPAM